jgi:hypothetical protein
MPRRKTKDSKGNSKFFKHYNANPIYPGEKIVVTKRGLDDWLA